jgi:hypothetical protein
VSRDSIMFECKVAKWDVLRRSIIATVEQVDSSQTFASQSESRNTGLRRDVCLYLPAFSATIPRPW